MKVIIFIIGPNRASELNLKYFDVLSFGNLLKGQ
jgi:hypothetical protein